MNEKFTPEVKEKLNNLNEAFTNACSYALAVDRKGITEWLGLSANERIIFGFQLANWQVNDVLYNLNLDNSSKNKSKLDRYTKLADATKEKEAQFINALPEDEKRMAHTVAMAGRDSYRFFFKVFDHTGQPIGHDKPEDIINWSKNWKQRLAEAEARTTDS